MSSFCIFIKYSENPKIYRELLLPENLVGSEERDFSKKLVVKYGIL